MANPLSFETIDLISAHVKEEIFSDERKIAALYAFNATGKTRLAESFRNIVEDEESEAEQVEAIIYSAHFEDAFSWNNETKTLHFGVDSSWILTLIKDEGLENQVADNFKRHLSTYTEPQFNFDDKSITFSLATGDEDRTENIKISKGEESLLIWSIFFTFLELIAQIREEREEDRATAIFNDIKYIIVDDPVSSIDDAKIINTGLDLTHITKKLAALDINVLITTHHALFYSVIVNAMKKKKQQGVFTSYNLAKDSDGSLVLSTQSDAPFAYHLHAKSLLEKAIEDDRIERYHFNMFRALLEKTANFLGYTDWTLCVDDENRETFVKLLHAYSHGRLADLESKELSSQEKDVFRAVFHRFKVEYKWGS